MRSILAAFCFFKSLPFIFSFFIYFAFDLTP